MSNNGSRAKIALLFALIALGPIFGRAADAATIFESGTLGPTGISWQDVVDQVVLGENLNANAINGVRFQLTDRVWTDRIGGHFVAGPSDTTDIYAAIVELTNGSDFPDSNDLSTPDVLGVGLLSVTTLSDEVSTELQLELDPGWYALVFGTGHYGATGTGATLLNNIDIQSPDYIGFLTGFGWGNRLPGKRFFLTGEVVPEPRCFMHCVVFLIAACAPHRFRFCPKCR